jgi:NAD(P)-dependent dehydrogenase (short-subunit alcohol dehydrogenase family)
VAIAMEFDLADEDSVHALFDRATAEFNGVDGLFNVGADLSEATLGHDGNLLDFDPAVWRRTFEVNLLGYVRTCKAMLPLMLDQGRGAIVNTSSNAAYVGEPTRPAYAACAARKPVSPGQDTRVKSLGSCCGDRVAAVSTDSSTAVGPRGAAAP